MMYGKHTDFRNFRITSDFGEEVLRYTLVECTDGMECDMCPNDAVYLSVPDRGQDDPIMDCSVGICQECAVDHANAHDIPDRWEHPHSFGVERYTSLIVNGKRRSTPVPANPNK